MQDKQVNKGLSAELRVMPGHVSITAPAVWNASRRVRVLLFYSRQSRMNWSEKVLLLEVDHEKDMALL